MSFFWSSGFPKGDVSPKLLRHPAGGGEFSKDGWIFPHVGDYWRLELFSLITSMEFHEYMIYGIIMTEFFAVSDVLCFDSCVFENLFRPKSGNISRRIGWGLLRLKEFHHISSIHMFCMKHKITESTYIPLVTHTAGLLPACYRLRYSEAPGFFHLVFNFKIPISENWTASFDHPSFDLWNNHNTLSASTLKMNKL